MNKKIWISAAVLFCLSGSNVLANDTQTASGQAPYELQAEEQTLTLTNDAVSAGNSEQSQWKLDQEAPKLEGFQKEYGTNTIIGRDDRKSVTNSSEKPYASIVMLETRFPNTEEGYCYRGTAFFIDDDTLMTAAHVVYSQTDGWVSDLKIYLNDANRPFTPETVNYTKISIPSQYSKQFADQYDYALIKVDKPVGYLTGSFELTSQVSTGSLFTLSGYPALMSGKTNYQQYMTLGTVSKIADGLIENRADTDGGMSGSPLFNSSSKVIGMHILGANEEAAAQGKTVYNAAKLIDDALISWVNTTSNGLISTYTVYNPNSGEHLLTTDADEGYYLDSVGWRLEGWKFFTVKNGTPVYRLYNPNAGDHHYTSSQSERADLIKAGWRDEGEAFQTTTSKTKPVYRLYNPNAKAGAHHFTTDVSEVLFLKKEGWRFENIAWYSA